MENEILKNIFLKALEIVKDKSKWTQVEYARSANDDLLSTVYNPSMALYPEAVCWCSVGAIIKATSLVKKSFDYQHHQSIIEEVDIAALIKVFNDYLLGVKPLGLSFNYSEHLIYDFNDSRSHEEVVALWESVGKSKGWLE